MAKPIKNTPVLKGKEAINFSNKIAANTQKKVSLEELFAVRESGKLLTKFFKA